MTFEVIPVGKVMHVTINHGIVHLDFEDYFKFFEKTRGKRPTRCEVYTSSSEPGRDYMLGFDFTWEDGTVERLSFKKFWDMLDKGMDWGSRSETLGKYSGHPYKVLDLLYSEVVFQTHACGACAFDRIHDRVTGTTSSVADMKRYVEAFDKGVKDDLSSGRWRHDLPAN